MSTIIATNQHYDFLNHCDNECKRIITPYIDGIQRVLFQEHNNNPYYGIPSVIKSICSAYYCKHLQYILSFKTLFAKYPTDYHLLFDYPDPHCKYDLRSCPSIQRIIHILTNFQSVYSQDVLSPYITYKYYQLKQILSDIKHINHHHPQNTVKFYIRNSVMKECSDLCSEYEYNDCTDSLDITNTEQWIKYNILNMHQQFIHHSQSKQQFECVLNRIITFNRSEHIRSLLDALVSVTKRLYKYDIKYQTLDSTNPIVQRKLLGFEGVLQFLSLLGFESNLLGTKLMCHHPPSIRVIQIAMSAINVQQSEWNATINHVVHIETEKKETELIGQNQIHLKSLILKSSDTDYVDIDDEVAVPMQLKGYNNDTGGIMSWFGDKWKRMNGKRKCNGEKSGSYSSFVH